MRKARARAAAQAVEKSPERLLRIDEVRRRIPTSVSTIYKLMSQGKFPRSRKVGRMTMWLESEIEAYIAGTWVPTRGTGTGGGSGQSAAAP